MRIGNIKRGREKEEKKRARTEETKKLEERGKKE